MILLAGLFSSGPKLRINIVNSNTHIYLETRSNARLGKLNLGNYFSNDFTCTKADVSIENIPVIFKVALCFRYVHCSRYTLIKNTIVPLPSQRKRRTRKISHINTTIPPVSSVSCNLFLAPRRTLRWTPAQSFLEKRNEISCCCCCNSIFTKMGQDEIQIATTTLTSSRLM